MKAPELGMQICDREGLARGPEPMTQLPLESSSQAGVGKAAFPVRPTEKTFIVAYG